MLYGIMLIYYEDYHESAIKEFDKLIKKIDLNSRLIIVSNNESLNSNTYLEGDNKNWEFSGWDKALKTIHNLNDTDSIIFANDTFMYNNPYGKLKAFFIKETFSYTYLKNKLKPDLFIAGSTCGLNETYTVAGFSADFWVSTYLFLVSGQLIKALGNQISLSQTTLNNIVTLGDNKKFKFNNTVSVNMQKHLQEWLYPEQDTKQAWYKAKEVSDEIKIKKVKMILNEKYISAFCYSNGGKIIDINPKKLFFRLFNKSYCK